MKESIEQMKMARFMIAAPKSGSGKTVLTCALLQSLKEQSKKVIAFKCGPDYIDPMFHKRVIGISSDNLDSFFYDEKKLQILLADKYRRENAEIAVIEGAMGLYDGLGGIQEEGSAYQIASITKTPVILVIDAHGMGRSVIPLIAGYLQYDHEHLIKGVILNKTTKGFYEIIRPVIEKELSIQVLGFFPKKEELALESRHLGLKLPQEVNELRKKIQAASDVIHETLELDKLIQIANEANAFPVANTKEKNKQPNVKIGIAMDEAFCFYYEQNLQLLREYGAELIPFSPIHDKKLPAGVCGLIFGGGYPELKAKELGENESMRTDILEKFSKGIPSLAECGGFMYLHDHICCENQESYPMTGIISGEVNYTGKLVRFGYVEITEKTPCFLPAGETIKGHEFHYFDSSNNGSDCVAVKPVTNKSWECIHATDNHFWGFAHLSYFSNPHFVEHFVKKALEFQKNH